MKDLVSVIVPTYNRSTFLKDCLLSIKAQTYKNIEVIVVDDGSDRDIAIQNKEIAFSNNCDYYYKTNEGAAASRNFGMAKSKGNYIAFCDDDDVWVKEKLEKQIAAFKKHAEVGLVTGAIEYITDAGDKTGKIKSHYPNNHGNTFEKLLSKNRTSTVTPLIKREVFDKVGHFNTSFVFAEDWEFWRRVSYNYKFYALDEVLAYVRLHNNNMLSTRTNTIIGRFRLYRKLTIAMLKWGKEKFNQEERHLIHKTEWQFYRTILSNNYSGFLKKLKFLFSLSLVDLRLAFHIIYLALKFELLK